MQRRTWAVMIVLAALLPGCGTPGELGVGSFFYDCASDSDTACNQGFVSDSDIPSPIGLDSRFELTFSADGAAARVEPASPEVAFLNGNVVTVTSPGAVALLARSGDRVVDFIHVDVVAPDELRIDVPGGDSDGTTIQVGNQRTVHVDPLSIAGSIVAGAYDYGWAIADPTIASVTGSPGDNEAVLSGLAAGTTTLTVTAAGLSESFTVEVLP